MREDTRSVFDMIRDEIREALEKTGTRTITIGLGGTESWAALIAATDLIGGDNVLAVTVHSTQTDSRIPWKMEAMCNEMRIEHCSIDVTRVLNEMLDSKIDLKRIQVETLHRTMDHLMKAEVMADIRDGMVRAVASRHNSLYIGAISKSKIDRSWGVPAAQSFDWNPVAYHTHHQLVRAICGRKIGNEISDMRSSLDLLPDSGPFPPDLSDDSNIQTNISIPRFGMGLFQEKKNLETSEEPHQDEGDRE